ncbi:glycosyltransferase involved in cell wall biosynthesis [Halopolyspora algeriensis]|uniref:Glycosyltransferase involved in cell wall biosynthesis n=1 Tax=Halopolyspora algeriensis TaxID=1500506 RepID=A0A368VTL4_9ACTN|nr:glycosyltransferase [Halopolyspora algeriensis]RCW44423.1 glycosyltransferase involved in cell wall biosynthesis [Halopolyspora algeriensis]TQM55784.1 glycosyltransferase involved in cell wall biosynthesis [Halopolyspora algeriensis]
MKVLHVITGLGVGGAELQLRSVLRHTRHDAEVVTLYNPGEVAEMISREGVRVHDLGMTSNTEVPALLRLWRLIRRGGYDVVHTHLYRACIYGRIAARLAGVPVVVTTEHSIGRTHLERRRMTRGVQALYLGTDLCSDATIAVSDTVADRLVKWGVQRNKITVIPNGVDFGRVAFDESHRARIRAEFAIPGEARVVGVLGRLDPNKRFDLVIEAMAPMLDATTRLLLIGEGPDRDRLESVVREHGVSERVVFAGERHDVAAMLSAMDLFVASSDQETFGLSVLEALANGMRALYTTCPAMDDIDTDRARAVPGEVAGMRREIAAELARMEPSWPGSSGGPPRETVPAIHDRYGIESVTGRIDDLYEGLLTRRGPRPPHPAPASVDASLAESTGGHR